MSKPIRFIAASLVSGMLALPGLASAQAVPRGSGSSSGSGSSGSSGSSGGGGGGGGESYSPPQRRPSSEGSRTGSAVSRRPSSSNPAPESGGSSSSGVSSPGERRSPRQVVQPAGSRDRGDRQVTGVAVPRQGVYIDPDDRQWRSGYPWYGSGLGLYYRSYPFSSYYYGYSAYSPFRYGSSRWIWGRYGSWYDPFGPFDYYGPFYDPYVYGGGYGYGYGGGAYPSAGRVTEQETTGSVRIRVKPREGQVYVDGTLMGIVDQFDGLTDHLVATAGQHEIEVRAPGHQPKKWIVDVPADRTITVRGSLDE